MCCTFLPTSHYHPRVKIQATVLWISLFVCVYHLPEPLLSPELSFHNCEIIKVCKWVVQVHICQCSHMNRCTEQSQSLKKLLEKKTCSITHWVEETNLWICQRHYLKLFLIGGVGQILVWKEITCNHGTFQAFKNMGGEWQMTV